MGLGRLARAPFLRLQRQNEAVADHGALADVHAADLAGDNEGLANVGHLVGGGRHLAERAGRQGQAGGDLMGALDGESFALEFAD